MHPRDLLGRVRGLSWKTALALVITALGATGIGVKELLSVPMAVWHQTAALAVSAGLGIQVVRLYAHLRLEYIRHAPGVMLAEIVIDIAWGVLAWQLRKGLDGPRAMSWAFAVFLLSLLCAGAARKARLMRGSDALRRCRSVVLLRGWIAGLVANPVFRWLKSWRPRRTEARVSGAVWLSAALLFVAVVVHAPATAIAVYQAMNSEGGDGKGAGTKQGAPKPDPSQPVAKAEPTPSVRRYEDVCPDAAAPGLGAPQPQAGDLHALWMGRPGIDGAGADEAGCAEPPVPSSVTSGLWWSVGRCGDRVMSLALAIPGRRPVLLLGEPARVAADFARSNQLTWAFPRTRIGSGDLQAVHTRRGTFVYVRDHLSAGTGGTSPGGRCRAASSRAAAYTEMPPGLLEGWAAVARDGWAWPRPLAGLRTYVFVTDVEEVAATASCESPGRCSVRYGTHMLPSTATSGSFDVQQLVDLAPPAPSPARP